MWKILGIVAVVLLIVFFFCPRRNAVWGGLTSGVIIGLIVTIIFVLKGNGFGWYVIGKCAISGIIIGFVVELVGAVSDLIKKIK